MCIIVRYSCIYLQPVNICKATLRCKATNEINMTSCIYVPCSMVINPKKWWTRVGPALPIRVHACSGHSEPGCNTQSAVYKNERNPGKGRRTQGLLFFIQRQSLSSHKSVLPFILESDYTRHLPKTAHMSKLLHSATPVFEYILRKFNVYHRCFQ